MPIYRLSNDLVFPNPRVADESGIIAIGGDLSTERLLLAYACGIFPWYQNGDPIIWWSPNPRCVLFPGELKISRSMAKFLRKEKYKVTFDRNFYDVINMCAKLREDNTWITEEIIAGYCSLYELGFAHSVETWYEGNLVGGLYGVSLGKCFFGESMFSIMDNASKTALVKLNKLAIKNKFLFIDCQVFSKHLESLGARNINRNLYLKFLKKGLKSNTIQGNWKLD